MGGKRKTHTGRGAVGKTAVVGAKDRDSNQVMAEVVEHTDASTLQGFVRESAKPGATVYTDEATVYGGLRRDFEHEAVNHSVGESVRDMAHTNGIGSFWSMLKRGYHGTCSPYLAEASAPICERVFNPSQPAAEGY